MPGSAPREPVVLVAFLAVCGALSYFLFAARNARDFPAGIPFGLLAAYLFVRSWKLWIIAVVLIDLVWIASERAAVFSIADHNADYYPGMAGAGLLGGLGVAASTGLGCRALLSLRSLAGASGAGGPVGAALRMVGANEFG